MTTQIMMNQTVINKSMNARMLQRHIDNVLGGIKQVYVHASSLGYQMDIEALKAAKNELERLKQELNNKR